MFNFKLTPEGRKNTVALQGSLTILSAEMLKPMLPQLIESQKPIFLDLADLEEIDLAGIQLIYMIYLSSLQHGLSFKLQSVRSNVLQIIKESGYARHFSSMLGSGRPSRKTMAMKNQ